jgi:hypothetical protein
MREKTFRDWNISAGQDVLVSEEQKMRCDTAIPESRSISEVMTPNIKDLRHHSPETLETLRGLLAGGADVRPDPKRLHFYELEGDTHVFYIYISPADGTVELLATWARADRRENSKLAARACC